MKHGFAWEMLLLYLQFFQALFVWGTVTGALNSSKLLFQSFFSDTMHGQSPRFAHPQNTDLCCTCVSVGSFFLTWKKRVKALTRVLSMQGFPSVTPHDQLGWEIFSWPSFHGLLLSCFFALIVLLHEVLSYGDFHNARFLSPPFSGSCSLLL